MLFIGLHVLVVFKNMSVKRIETLSPDLMNITEVDQPMYQHLTHN